MRSIKKILCAIDFLQHSSIVTDYSKTMAKAFGAEIVVLYVSSIFSNMGGHYEVDPKQIKDIENELFTAAHATMDKYIAEHFSDVKAVGKVTQGNPAEEILDQAQKNEVDLIVMGTLGRTGLNLLFFGSVAEKVVKGSPVPVLTIRPPQANG